MHVYALAWMVPKDTWKSTQQGDRHKFQDTNFDRRLFNSQLIRMLRSVTLLLHMLFASNNREEQLKPRITKSFSEKCQVSILGFMFSAQPRHSAKRVHTQLATETPCNESNYSKTEKPFLAAALQKEALGQSVSPSAALGVRTAEK